MQQGPRARMSRSVEDKLLVHSEPQGKIVLFSHERVACVGCVSLKGSNQRPFTLMLTYAT